MIYLVGVPSAAPLILSSPSEVACILGRATSSPFHVFVEAVCMLLSTEQVYKMVVERRIFTAFTVTLVHCVLF